jgi:hypothetical protein
LQIFATFSDSQILPIKEYARRNKREKIEGNDVSLCFYCEGGERGREVYVSFVRRKKPCAKGNSNCQMEGGGEKRSSSVEAVGYKQITINVVLKMGGGRERYK